MSTTVAKSYRNEKGQSVLEVVFVLPFLFLFVGMLFKLNMGIQQAINNTQYARSQIYVLTANSPEYPRLQFTQYSDTGSGSVKMFSAAGQDMMVLGVADPSAISDSEGDGLQPIPQTQSIARNKSVKGNTVHIRNTAAICTQLNIIPKVNGTSQRWPFGGGVCQYQGMSGG